MPRRQTRIVLESDLRVFLDAGGEATGGGSAGHIRSGDVRVWPGEPLGGHAGWTRLSSGLFLAPLLKETFMSAAKTAPSDWITSADALRRHPELSRVKLYRLAASQLIRTTVPPGSARASRIRCRSCDVGQKRRRAVTRGGHLSSPVESCTSGRITAHHHIPARSLERSPKGLALASDLANGFGSAQVEGLPVMVDHRGVD